MTELARRSNSKDSTVSVFPAITPATARPLQMVNQNNARRRATTTIRRRSNSSPPPTFVVCVSGLHSAERQHARNVVERLGGVYDEQFTSGCTHLIVHRVGSKKYQSAVQHSVPIVTYEFIRACDTEDAVVDFRPYQIGPFSGLVICSTGLAQAEAKAQLKETIERHGGVYDGVLASNKTTHLVIYDDGYDKAKHRVAVAHGIETVSPEWIDACVDSGAWCPESDYRPRPPSSAERDVENENADAATRGPLDDAPDLDALIRKKSGGGEGASTLNQKRQRTEADTDELILDRVMKQDCHDALFNTFIYVECRHDLKWRATLQSLARFCGARVLWTFNPGLVTHVIVASPTDASDNNSCLAAIREYVQQCPSVHLVKPEFITACATEMELVDVAKYMWAARSPQILRDKLVCVTGYVGDERREVERIAKELGGQYTERLTPLVDLLISLGQNSEKYLKAREWNIEVQSIEWLRSKMAA